MAGIHQLWTFDPGPARPSSPPGPPTRALSTARGDAWFAQPSGLAPDGDRLWIADAEVSALRWIDTDGVHTAGRTGAVRLRLPRRQGRRGAAPAPARRGYPAGRDDRRCRHLQPGSTPLRPGTTEVSTIARDLPEVSGLVVTGAGLVAVESAAHRLSLVATSTAVSASGMARTTSRPTLDIAADGLELEVVFTPPPGEKLDDRFGPSPACSSTPPRRRCSPREVVATPPLIGSW